MSDFAAISRNVLEDLRTRVGMEVWMLSRRDGLDQVVLSVVDETFGIQAGSSYPWADSFCAAMIDGQAPMIAPNVDLVPAYAAARARSGIAARSYLTVPVLAPDGEHLGSLCALDQRERHDLDDYLSTVQLQAVLLGALLSHELHLAHEVRRIERAESQVNTDLLTGTGNRRAWEAALRAEEKRAGRYATGAAVIIINLDELRDVNAVSGHQAGDELLIRSAALLSKRLRAVDVVTRLGGDDFGIILPLTSAEDAQTVATDLRRLMHQARIGAAIGVGQRRSDTGMAGAWTAADRAMSADRLQAAQRRIAFQDLPPEPVTRAQLSATALESTSLSSVDALLQLARTQLGMDVAFLNTFEGSNRRFRNLVSAIDLPVKVGFTEPREGTFCQLIVEGKLEEVTTDVAAHPLLQDLPVTRTLGIGSYIGVALHRRNGALYGTLCAFSRQVDHTLRERDTGVLRAIAGVVMDLVEIEDQGNHSRHDTLQRLDSLYADNGPQIVYQPIQTLDRCETVGVEALSRFPVGSANPDEWFSSAAAAGVGITLELAALQNAVLVLPHLHGFLAVNASPAALVSPGFSRLMNQLPLHRIVLEITEHEAIEDYQTLVDALKPLRRSGIRVAIDDAGAGFASMRHILMLVPDFIKLDISLVRGIDTDRPRQALAAALSAFAFKTGALVIAEGIETAEELECLRMLNIDYGQGYHLSRPAPIHYEPAPIQHQQGASTGGGDQWTGQS